MSEKVDVSELEFKKMFHLESDFVQNIEKDPRLMYADTDSAYVLVKLPFNKFENIRQTVDYSQKVCIKMNEVYIDALNYYVGKFGHMDLEFNTMDFKSEVVAFKGFFGKKKFYALAKIWDEGEFYDEPKPKKTGGQIAKADITAITKEIITEIYNIIVMDVKEVDLRSMYKKIFIDLKNKSSMRLRNSIKNYNFADFGIPKKWGMKAAKRITAQVIGGKLYNTVIADEFRPGDSFLMIQIKINNISKMKKYIKEKPLFNTDNRYFLCDDDINSKLKTISIPNGLQENDTKKVIETLNEMGVVLDFDTIMNFNITLKMDPFINLFPQKIRLGA